jgi:hypothetical protein
LAVLQDLLVVRQTSAVHDQIYRFLAFLRELDGLPRPWELDQVQTGAWQAELVRKARTIDDPLKRRYVFACLAMIAEPNAEVVQLVGELLSGPDFCSRPDDAYCVGLLIHRLLTSAPSPDEELVRLVSSGAQRRQAILALVAVGDPAAESLSRVLQRPSGACTLALKSLGPHRLNPEYSLPRWLRWLAPVPNDVTLEIIGALDPSGRRAYAVIERWRREPGDLSPDRIEQTQEALDSYFRQEPQPEAKL